MSRFSSQNYGEQFIKKATIKYGNKFDYSKVVYIKSSLKILIKCNLHEIEFLQTPSNHIYGYSGCPICSKLKTRKALGHTKEDFVKACSKIHSNKYDYSQVIYENWESMVIIGCPYHGDFVQQANSHKQGTGCPTCSKYKTSRLGGMSNLKGLDEEPVHFYIVSFKNSKYSFVKVGLTSRTVEKRFKPIKYREYTLQVLLDEVLPSKQAIQLESDTLMYFENNRYYISEKKDSFKGCTEIFKKSVEEDLVNYVKERISSSHE